MKLFFVFAIATLVHIGLAKVTNKNGLLGYHYRSNDDKHGKSHDNETMDGLERKEVEEIDGRNFSGLGSHGKVEQHGLVHLHDHGKGQQDQKPHKNQVKTQDDDHELHWHPHDDSHGHEDSHHEHHHEHHHKHRNRRYDGEEDYYQDNEDPHAHDGHSAHHHDNHHKVVRRQRRLHHRDLEDDDDN